MTERRNDTGLDAFLAAARDEAPLPSGDFLARVEADALAEQARRVGMRPARPGPFAQLRAVLGGWPGLAGLAATCAAGVWIGVNPPADLSDLWNAAAGLGTLGVDPLSGYDLAMMEG